MAMIAIFGCFGTARAVIQNISIDPAQTLNTADSLGAFPDHIGTYKLVRSWNETLRTGPLLFHWAEYAAANEGSAHLIGNFSTDGYPRYADLPLRPWRRSIVA